MSWIYTLVFTGLMFSSQGELAPDLPQAVMADEPMPVVVMADETEKFDQTYPLNGNGRVSVSNVNGSITLEAWERNEIKLSYTKIADSKERLANVEVKIDAKPDAFRVETDYGNWNGRDNRWKSGGKLTVEIHMMVPRGAVLNEIETVNGSVSVANFVNVTKVSAVNGSIQATNIRGNASLCTVNGEVAADFDRLETGSKISLETVNGRASLTIPSDANATIKADSLNGNISNDFNLPVHKGKYVGRDLYGRIGSGDVQIKLNSVNGPLSISRKNDGKPLSPSTNLLQNKEKDDEDWNMDEDESANKAVKANKEIAKAARVAERESIRAARQAEREIQKAMPDIEKFKEQLIEAEKLNVEIKGSEDMRREIMTQIANAGFTSAVPKVEKKGNSFAVKGVPAVTLNAGNCSVSVRGWDRDEVQYTTTQVSNFRNRAAIKITEDHTDTSVDIGIRNEGLNSPKVFTDPNALRIEVFVPRRSNLKITSSAEIRLEGVTGEVDLTGADEAINVRDLEGKLKILNADGRVRVIGFRGELDAQTADGTLNLEGDFKKLNAKGVNGRITLVLPDTASAELEATTQDVQNQGVSMVRLDGDESRSRYKIGNGGTLFQVATDGEILVRSADALKGSY